MAQLTVEVPDVLVPRVMAALRAQFPEAVAMTDGQIARHFIRFHLRSQVAQHEERVAAEAAKVAAQEARDKAYTDTMGIG